MADTVIVGCLFTILLINACNGGFGLPGLVATDENSTHSSGADVQLIEDKDSIHRMMVQQPRYKCHQCEWQECLMGEVTLCTEALFCYKSSVRDSDGELRYSRGCSVASDHAQFTCRHKTPQGLSKRHAGQVNVICCSGDLCNAGSFPPLAQESGEPLRAPAWRLGAGLAVAALALAAVAATAVLLLRKTHRLRVSQAALHKLGADSNYFSSNVYTPQVTCAFYEGLEGSQSGVRATAAGDSTLREYLQGSLSSGSGSGLPLMVQRTLSKQVTLLECVGKGRYGSVWRGLWCADSVAVKIFFSRDEASWRRETEIYSTVLLRHSNILAYVGSDMTSRNSCTQLWLITHFHPLGSLYEHLGRTTLTRQQMMVMSLSIVNGLLHLHTDIHGTQGKPAIAHRDIKSKNILVKVNGECCIADFGLAMTAAHAARAQPGPPQGTVRYMSPELLDQSMNVTCLEAHRRCDLYALALVLWELARRVAPAREARAPYSELAPGDPPHSLMRKLVAVDAARPAIPAHTHPTMVGLAALISECWHQNAAVRLPALRVKKTLLKLAARDPGVHLDDAEVAL